MPATLLEIVQTEIATRKTKLTDLEELKGTDQQR
jgi:hypothetical protein